MRNSGVLVLRIGGFVEIPEINIDVVSEEIVAIGKIDTVLLYLDV